MEPRALSSVVVECHNTDTIRCRVLICPKAVGCYGWEMEYLGRGRVYSDPTTGEE
jgi:hypothetical protein